MAIQGYVVEIKNRNKTIETESQSAFDQDAYKFENSARTVRKFILRLYLSGFKPSQIEVFFIEFLVKKNKIQLLNKSKVVLDPFSESTSSTNQMLEELLSEFEESRKKIKELATVLDHVPPCPKHGKRCIEFCSEWIEKAKKAYVNDLVAVKPVRRDPRLNYTCTKKNSNIVNIEEVTT